MQIVDFQRNKKDSFVNIDDVNDICDHIYCYKSDNAELFFLKFSGDVYWWNGFTLRNDEYAKTYTTLKEALTSCSCQRVMIFNSQEEVREYLKTM